MKQTENPDSCSFCNKHKDAVIKLIVGEDVAICNECVELCETLLVDEPVAKPVDHVSLDYHSFSFRTNDSGNRFSSNIESLLINIGKNWSQSSKRDCICARNPSKCR
jgi:hypothetical protein